MNSNEDNNKKESRVGDALGIILILGILGFFLFPLLIPIGIMCFVIATGGSLLTWK